MNEPEEHPALRVILVTAGEPLPLDRADIRLHRTGQLAAWLAAHGHRVDWVTNRFDHFRKMQRVGPATQQIATNYRVQLVSSPGYVRNVGVRRLVDHAVLGRRFRLRTREWDRPDIVVAAMPTIELAAEAMRWARSIGAPGVVDIRDLWPDVMIESVPSVLRPLARVALSGQQRRLRSALQSADALFTQNESFLSWALEKAGRERRDRDAVIPFGFSPPDVSPKEETAARDFWRTHGVNLPDGSAPLLVYVGALSSQRDFEPVIAASRTLQSLGAHTVLCGTGDQEASLRRVATSLPNLHVPGWCSATQMAVLLRHATLGLMPYVQSENFAGHLPNKVGEYLAFGLPVAWSLGTGPIGDLIRERDVGFSYAANAAVLAENVARLLADPMRRAGIAPRARRVFEEQFSAEVNNQRMERAIWRVVSDTRPPTQC